MVTKSYIPSRGDLIWVNFSPAYGHEQRGKRPAIVISPTFYNEKSGIALICPITSKAKGYPFEVFVSEGKIKGVILPDQIKSVDWKERRVKFVAQASPQTIRMVQKYLALLIAG